MMPYVAITWIGLLVPASPNGLADEKPARKSATAKEIRALVKQLASPNKAPKIDGPEAKYPQGYDNAAQERVFDARHRLEGLGLKAIPYLLEKGNDHRYSFTQDDGPGDGNWFVGETCLILVQCQLQPYSVKLFGDRALDSAPDPRTHPLRPSYMKHYKLDNPKAAMKWWQQRKDKSLRELQIEALEWVIGREEKAPKKYSVMERRFLRSTLNKLRAGNTPLNPADWPVSR